MSTPAHLRPAAACRTLLAALDASEGRRGRRKRDTTPDAIGMALKRHLLEEAVLGDPEPEQFEAWLLGHCLSSGMASTGAMRAMAREVLTEWELTTASVQFREWLTAGAPSEDKAREAVHAPQETEGPSQPSYRNLEDRIMSDGKISAPTRFPVHYHTARVNGLDVFYREAGPSHAPVLLLLHGFPTSSNMFRNLIPRLAGSFHVVAPDFPGFGQSSMPDRERFAYTFENITNVVDTLVGQLGLGRFSIYVMDYGAPVGYRLALRRPEQIEALIVQNGNAYEEGLREFWDPIKKYWTDPRPENRTALHVLVDPKSTRWQYENGVADRTLLDPTTWILDQVGLDRPGNREIQMDLFYDYRTNVPLYPQFQEFFRKYQPPTLIVWGKNDVIFPPEGAVPYRRDLPNAETHLLDTGHFALETHGEEIAGRIEGFLLQLKRDQG